MWLAIVTGMTGLSRLRVQSRRAARAAGLRYIEDAAPGLSRAKRRGKFVYCDRQDRPIRDEATLARIRRLAIPPAWTDVWICNDPVGHLQATGRDARGRKQYRYHTQWSLAREIAKHRRICEFARQLPDLRAHCQRSLRRPGLARETVLAALLRVIDLTAIRVGHEEYTRENASFGLTTLRAHHARVRGSAVELRFRGKSGVQRLLRFRDARLANMIEHCRRLRGRQLFQYLDDANVPQPVHAGHLNTYLRSLTAAHFSVKDFRTWSATVNVAVALRECGPASSQRAARKTILEAVRKAADCLGNTPAVCRKSYIHPVLLEAYLDGHTLPADPAPGRAALDAQERAVLAFLERSIKRATRLDTRPTPLKCAS